MRNLLFGFRLFKKKGPTTEEAPLPEKIAPPAASNDVEGDRPHDTPPISPFAYPRITNDSGLPWDFWDILIHVEGDFGNQDVPRIRKSADYNSRLRKICYDPLYAKTVDRAYYENPDFQALIESIKESDDYLHKIERLLAQPRYEAEVDYLLAQYPQFQARVDEIRASESYQRQKAGMEIQYNDWAPRRPVC